MKGNYKIRCNNCMEVYDGEESLVMVRDEFDNEIVKGCGDCETDSYLMNIEK